MNIPGVTGPLTVFKRKAMATEFEVSVNETDSDIAASIALDALDEIDRIEEELSVFRPTSLISRINLLAHEMNIRVPQEVFDWILVCRQLWEETEGAFDITSAPLWQLWGFARREGKIPEEQKIKDILPNIGMQNIRLNEEDRSIAFDREGVSLNFGGIGKGIALDCTQQIFNRQELSDYLIQGGQSSALAWGGRLGDGNAAEKPEKSVKSVKPLSCWTIGVTHPLRPNRYLAQLHLHNCALGTSGSQYQFFRYRGKRYSHILDPRTGLPALGLLSTIVLAPSAAMADALSTAFFVLGPDKTDLYCRNHPEISALLLVEIQKEPGLEMIALNLDDSVLEVL